MKKVVFLLLVIFPSISFSQNEAAIWYFGQYAGLDFNSGVPVVLTDGQINTFEGCATISDFQGNLLFYTDGVTVWDKGHNVMPNGTGLLGNISSTQSAIIVPKPNNLNQYYIFSVDDRNAFSALSSNGIRFSTVDLTLNGGMGDVISSEKNLVLVSQAYEKVTAVKHADNNSFWVISFIQNQFLAWRVDATGVNTTPVISNVSTANDSRGYLKISPNGNKIACANFGNVHSMMIYDFNTATGVVNNEIQLTLDENDDIPYGVEFSTQSRKLYVTTSKLNVNDHMPPGKLLQFDMLAANISASRVLLHTSNVNTRGALQLAIDGKIYRALSISGANQAGTAFLGVINNPEADGLASNYVHDAIDISNGDPNRKVVEGLPPFIQSFFLTTISANDVCFGDTTQFTLNSTTPPTSVSWDFGDPSTGINNTSTDINPTHVFSSSGVFTVTATVTIGVETTVLTLQVTIFDLPVVTSPVVLTQCDDNIDGIVNFNLEDANTLISSENPAPTITYFLTETDAINNTNAITNPTVFSNGTAPTVWARVENAASCFTTAQVNLQVAPTNIPVVTSPVTLVQCDDDIDGIVDFNLEEANTLISSENPAPAITYYLTENDAINSTNVITTPTVFSNGTAPTVWARIQNTSNCFATAQVDLQVASTNIPSDLMLVFNECDDIADNDDTNGITTFDFSSATNQILEALLPEQNLSITYFENITDALAEQNNIDPTNYRNTISPSTIQLVVRVDNLMNDCFGLGYHITLNVDSVPQFDLLNAVSLCLNSSNPSIRIENPLSTYEYIWRDEQNTIIGTTPEIIVNSEGLYSVTATDTNGNSCEKTKTIQVNETPVTPLLNFDINNIQITDNTYNNNSVTVQTNNLPNSTYEFALDDSDFQLSNLFENVLGGVHTVYIRDIENCQEASVEISLISVPNFFTPNNDGYNDTWQVTGVEFQPSSKIYIFDRFGKLIKVLSPLSLGWDGYYKGNPLPSTDYWYKVELEDSRILKGHFSLIRR